VFVSESKFFQLMVERSPDLTVVVGSDGLIEYANEAHLTLLGSSAEDVVGMPALHLVHPDDRPAAAIGLLDTAAGTAAPGGVPLRLSRRDGSWLRVNTEGNRLDEDRVMFVSRPTSAVEPSESGEVERIAGILRAQQETTPDGVLVVAEGGATISYNENFLRLWKMSAEVAEGGFGARAGHVSGMLADPDRILRVTREIYEHPMETCAVQVELADGR
jgi:PAS domain S-box-containing protein